MMRVLVLCIVVLGLIAPARAQDVPFEIAGLPITAQSVRSLPEQKLLTTSEIERALSSYPDVRNFADRHAKEWNGYEINPQSADPIGDVRGKMSADGSLSEFESLVKRFGFTGFDDWTRTAFSILTAFGFDRTPLAAAKTLSPVTRQMMFAQMPELRVLYNKLEPPAANVSAVALYTAQIEKIIAAQ